jgi:hypothetical protein
MGAVMRIAIMVVLSALLSGCVTRYPVKQYAVGGFTLIVAEQDYIRKVYAHNYGIDLPRIGGFCDQDARVLFVQYDKFDYGRPDFAVLGHEVWHLWELGGNFHK